MQAWSWPHWQQPYYVNWKLQYRHVITLDEKTVRITRVITHPGELVFERAQSSLAVTKTPWDGPTLALHDKEQTVEVGEFLNREDSLPLLSLLRQGSKSAPSDWRYAFECPDIKGTLGACHFPTKYRIQNDRKFRKVGLFHWAAPKRL